MDEHFSAPAQSRTRRQFLRMGAGALGVMAVGGCAGGGVQRPSSDDDGAASGVVGTPFEEPTQIRSRAGRLDVRLVASVSSDETGMFAYNGAAIGPTLRVRPGDTVTVDLVNDLDEATNLHTHGLLVSPSGRSDNVFVGVEPGETRRYEYEIPHDHPAGTFWYHPHVHGSVARQTAAGLVGAIIVEPTEFHPVVGAMPERLFVLNDPISANRSVSRMDEMHGRAGGTVRVNGIVAPLIDAVASGPELWRVVNASASRRLPFGVDGRLVFIVGLDGDSLYRPEIVNGVVLSPGERADIVVDIDRGESRSIFGDGTGQPIATVVSRDGPTTSQAFVPPSQLRPAEEFDIAEVTGRRTIRFGADGGGMMGRSAFTIDGRSFDAARVDVTTSIGAVEEWTIVNETMIDHPFHLHAWPFLFQDDRLGPVWKDTVNVPGGSSIVVTIPFVARSGRSVYHCHVLDHEDLGMMGVIDVRPARSP